MTATTEPASAIPGRRTSADRGTMPVRGDGGRSFDVSSVNDGAEPDARGGVERLAVRAHAPIEAEGIDPRRGCWCRNGEQRMAAAGGRDAYAWDSAVAR